MVVAAVCLLPMRVLPGTHTGPGRRPPQRPSFDDGGSWVEREANTGIRWSLRKRGKRWVFTGWSDLEKSAASRRMGRGHRATTAPCIARPPARRGGPKRRYARGSRNQAAHTRAWSRTHVRGTLPRSTSRHMQPRPWPFPPRANQCRASRTHSPPKATSCSCPTLSATAQQQLRRAPAVPRQGTNNDDTQWRL